MTVSETIEEAKKVGVKDMSWKAWFMIITIISAATVASYYGVNVTMNLDLANRVGSLEGMLSHTINSTFYALQKPASYIVSAVTSGGTTYYCMQNGTTGKLDFWSTNASQVINFALGNLTANRVVSEKVLIKGNITLTHSILVSSYTDLEIQGRITLATASNCEMIKQSSTNIQYVYIHGGIFNGNLTGQSVEKNGIDIEGDWGSNNNPIVLDDITIQAVRGWGVRLKNLGVSCLTRLNIYDDRCWYGIKLEGCADISISDCVISALTGDGVADSTCMYLDKGTASIRIDNCYFGGGMYGVDIHGAYNIKFSNCINNDMYYYCYYFHDDGAYYARFNTIVGGRCASAHSNDIYLTGHSYKNIISSVEFIETGSFYTAVYGVLEDSSANYNLIHGNIFEGQSTDGVLKAGANTIVTDNIGD